MEHLPYGGQSSDDRHAYWQYLKDIERGKSLQQLIAVKNAMTPDIYRSWSAGTHTSVMTPQGSFDAIVCTVSYHFNKHGARYGTVSKYTHAAQQYLRQNRSTAKVQDGKLKLPQGTYEPDGRILTFS